MKKILLLFISATFLSLNAQIFINTNPKSDGASKTVREGQEMIDNTQQNSQNTINSVQSTINGQGINNNTVSNKVRTSVSGTNVTSGNNTVRSTGIMSASGDVPPNAEPGKCYARCQIEEDQYRYDSRQVVTSPRTVKRIKLPALYTTVYDTIVIRPQSVRYEDVPAQYETIREQKMVAPSTTKWVKGKADAGCLSADPNDCQVMCLVEVPAQYKTITKKVVKHGAYKREVSVPMDYKIVAKQVKIQNERFTEQVIPASYKTIQERVLVSKGGYQEWREVLCGSDLTTAKISQIQAALRAANFDPGPIDNVFGSKTKEALKAYQKANGLPVGNLNLETLRALGVK